MSRTLLLSFVRLGILGVLEFGLTVKLLGPAPPRTEVLSAHPETDDLVRRWLMQGPGNSPQRACILATMSLDRG